MAHRSHKDQFTQCMINLRAHMLKCTKCRFAFGDGATTDACENGVVYAVALARSADKLLETKRKAVSTISGHVYACPDVSAHGDAYALTAEPLSVAGMQDGLF